MSDAHRHMTPQDPAAFSGGGGGPPAIDPFGGEAAKFFSAVQQRIEQINQLQASLAERQEQLAQREREADERLARERARADQDAQAREEALARRQAEAQQSLAQAQARIEEIGAREREAAERGRQAQSQLEQARATMAELDARARQVDDAWKTVEARYAELAAYHAQLTAAAGEQQAELNRRYEQLTAYQAQITQEHEQRAGVVQQLQQQASRAEAQAADAVRAAELQLQQQAQQLAQRERELTARAEQAQAQWQEQIERARTEAQQQRARADELASRAAALEQERVAGEQRARAQLEAAVARASAQASQEAEQRTAQRVTEQVTASVTALVTQQVTSQITAQLSAQARAQLEQAQAQWAQRLEQAEHARQQQSQEHAQQLQRERDEAGQRVGAAEQAAQQAVAAMRATQAQLEELQARPVADPREIETLRAALDARERALLDADRHSDELQARLQASQSEAGELRASSEQHSASAAQLQQKLDSMARRLFDAQSSLAALGQSQSEGTQLLQRQVEALQADVRRAGAERVALTQQLEQAQQARAQAERQLAEQAEAAQRQLREVSERAQRAQQDSQRAGEAGQEGARLREQLSAATQRLTQIEGELGVTRREMAAAAQALLTSKAELSELQARAQAGSSEHDQQLAGEREQVISQLQARVRTLQDMLDASGGEQGAGQSRKTIERLREAVAQREQQLRELSARLESGAHGGPEKTGPVEPGALALRRERLRRVQRALRERVEKLGTAARAVKNKEVMLDRIVEQRVESAVTASMLTHRAGAQSDAPEPARASRPARSPMRVLVPSVIAGLVVSALTVWGLDSLSNQAYGASAVIKMETGNVTPMQGELESWTVRHERLARDIEMYKRVSDKFAQLGMQQYSTTDAVQRFIGGNITVVTEPKGQVTLYLKAKRPQDAKIGLKLLAETIAAHSNSAASASADRFKTKVEGDVEQQKPERLTVPSPWDTVGAVVMGALAALSLGRLLSKRAE